MEFQMSAMCIEFANNSVVICQREDDVDQWINGRKEYLIN